MCQNRTLIYLGKWNQRLKPASPQLFLSHTPISDPPYFPPEAKLRLKFCHQSLEPYDLMAIGTRELRNGLAGYRRLLGFLEGQRPWIRQDSKASFQFQSEFLSRKAPKTLGKQNTDRFLNRTMVKKNGQGSNPRIENPPHVWGGATFHPSWGGGASLLGRAPMPPCPATGDGNFRPGPLRHASCPAKAPPPLGGSKQSVGAVSNKPLWGTVPPKKKGQVPCAVPLNANKKVSLNKGKTQVEPWQLGYFQYLGS